MFLVLLRQALAVEAHVRVKVREKVNEMGLTSYNYLLASLSWRPSALTLIDSL